MTLNDLGELLQGDLLAYFDELLSNEQRTTMCQIVLQRIRGAQKEERKKMKMNMLEAIVLLRIARDKLEEKTCFDDRDPPEKNRTPQRCS